MAERCIWIVLLPLIAFVIQALVGKKLPRHGDFISVGAILGSFCLATPIFLELLRHGHVSDSISYTWMSLPRMLRGGAELPLTIEVGIAVNNLTAIMLFMVTLCASLIHIFAVGYMHGEERYHLFFAYISLFSAGMLGLVVSDNLLTFFMCWEIMGLCSYLLIGFYYKKLSANYASLKAFMTTRIGDVGFFLGIAGLYYVFGTSQFGKLYGLVSEPQVTQAMILGIPALVFIGFAVMMGTVGKSAQFPLHVWLPDAMEGPTPVSALIHAATMVAAGVFLLIRMYPLLQAASIVLTVTAHIGAFTALFAALIALVQVDIKKVLAYSTISQLGFMVMSVGVGAFSAALMHLLTHACFKACLFLCSGSVIHAVHTQDMREMGGLRTKMPWTFLCMFISTLAISGVPFFSGFVSKDRILAGALGAAMEHGHWIIPILGFTTAGLTAFYMFRLIYMTFFGHARDEHKHHHAHEQPVLMVFPLVVLATLSLALWWSGPTGFDFLDARILPVHWYDHSVEHAEQIMGISAHHGSEEIHHKAHSLALILSLCLAGAGIFLSTITYLKHWISAEKLKNTFAPIHTVLTHKFYFDELYINIIVQKIVLTFNRLLARFDDGFVDRVLVDGWRDVMMVVKSIVGKFDDVVVDQGMVDGTARVTAVGGWMLRIVQTGRVQQYVVWTLIVLGLALYSL